MGVAVELRQMRAIRFGWSSLMAVVYLGRCF
jgi:hypothetical protein